MTSPMNKSRKPCRRPIRDCWLGRLPLQLTAVATDLIPVVTDPEGYIDLFAFLVAGTWSQPLDDDLERIFRPMLSYAKNRRAKG